MCAIPSTVLRRRPSLKIDCERSGTAAISPDRVWQRLRRLRKVAKTERKKLKRCKVTPPRGRVILRGRD